jgi:apolipoprotein N-acyltransferase
VAVALRAVVAGLALAASVPPWGWWPLAFVGIALLDTLVADRPWRSRFARTWLVAMAWLYPALLWMLDLTPPGYVVAGGFFAAYFALAAALTPPGRLGRLVVLPGAVALAELARWSWPFGGVPLAHLALGQANSPLGQAARLGGSALVVVLVVVTGQVLASLARRDLRAAAVGAMVVAGLVAGGFAWPRSSVVRTADVALVQGGGRQQTRASSDQQPVVLARHVEASRFLPGPVDLVIWPENVVNPGATLSFDRAFDLVHQVAADTGAAVLAGWFYPVSERSTVNYQSTILPSGDEVDRYEKVQIVPFGEYVPLRGLIERFSQELPGRDVLRGTDNPVLDTPIGPVGVSISWEGFFESRARASVADGAQLLANPTNGSTYWLTQVHTQQVASNQLRAIETDRWVLQVAPTGFSAVIDPDGQVLERTGISERATLRATVEMRQGRTPASRFGFWPVTAYGLSAVVGAQALDQLGRRRRPAPLTGPSARSLSQAVTP